MKSKLLGKEQLKSMLSMSPSEITRILQESDYGEEINQLGVSYQGLELIDHALARNTVRNMEKLRRISNETLQKVVDSYLQRYDIENIKIILRAKYLQQSSEEAKRMLVPAGIWKEQSLLKLLELPSIEVIVRHLGMPSDAYAIGLYHFTTTQNLATLENCLDQWYYQQLADLSEHIRGEGQVFKRFLKEEVFIKNLLIVLRLKTQGAPAEEIVPQIIAINPAVKYLFQQIAACPWKETIMHIHDRKLKAVVEKSLKAYEETGSLVTLEIACRRFLFERTTLLQHQNPLSIDVILSYIFQKEIEAANLRLIIKGKKLGMETSFIEEQLMV